MPKKNAIHGVAAAQVRLFLQLPHALAAAVEVAEALDQRAEHQGVGVGLDLLGHLPGLGEQLVEGGRQADVFRRDPRGDVLGIVRALVGAGDGAGSEGLGDGHGATLFA
jgi:hypothetical protein